MPISRGLLANSVDLSLPADAGRTVRLQRARSDNAPIPDRSAEHQVVKSSTIRCSHAPDDALPIVTASAHSCRRGVLSNCCQPALNPVVGLHESPAPGDSGLDPRVTVGNPEARLVQLNCVLGGGNAALLRERFLKLRL